MAQFFSIHPENPQARLIKQAVEIVARGGVVAYPTDSAYALACRLENKDGLERIVRIRDMDRDHNFTLVAPIFPCWPPMLGWITRYFALKSHTPGPFTFILPATREVPKRLCILSTHHRAARAFEPHCPGLASGARRAPHVLQPGAPGVRTRNRS